MNKEHQEINKSNQQYQFLLRGVIVGVSSGGVMALNQPKTYAITTADVVTGVDAITAGADTTADTALPIGLGILAISIIGMVLRRFIMV